ncbi:MAG: UDP-N-acetylglucosamine 1-carboxyvinyltransferase [Peptococcaceae bacterium]|nr:MAG: UDP-N-acetylglucosamine 1-carboxyvinyltransferase [Peptococcaceae bacterium]
MKRFFIRGGKRLQGRVRINGAKNASLAILCASMLAQNEVVLENVPAISDVLSMVEIINRLGCGTVWEDVDVLRISPPSQVNDVVPHRFFKKLRASNLLLGPLLARFGRAHIALPGGCNIGVRPMDLHFKGLTGLGAKVSLEHGYIRADSRRLHGAQIYLDFPSVGATENIMMAACLAEGQTVVENAAKEPEVVDLANFLNNMGAKVRGAGTDVVKIEGVSFLPGGVRYSVIPDRIEAGTFMVAAAATGGDVLLENVIPLHLEPLRAKLREAKVEVAEDGDTLRVRVSRPLCSIDIKTMPYPGFPTDMQSQMMVLLSTIPGTSIIVENIFENRFMVVNELKRMGARVKVEGRMAIVEGVPGLQGTQVKTSDLRAGAALIVAGLVADGETVICNAHYVDRGYYRLEERLRELGADIRSV